MPKRPKSRTSRTQAKGRRKRRASPKAKRRALKAVSLMRKGLSRSKAAKRAKTTGRTIQRYARPAVRRRRGHYEARPNDTLPRAMRMLSEDGVTAVEIRGSTAATHLSRYWHAVDHYLRTGDRRLLLPFEGKALRAGGHRFPFLTDTDTLERLAEAGEVQFEDLYETTA